MKSFSWASLNEWIWLESFEWIYSGERFRSSVPSEEFLTARFGRTLLNEEMNEKHYLGEDFGLNSSDWGNVMEGLIWKKTLGWTLLINGWFPVPLANLSVSGQQLPHRTRPAQPLRTGRTVPMVRTKVHLQWNQNTTLTSLKEPSQTHRRPHSYQYSYISQLQGRHPCPNKRPFLPAICGVESPTPLTTPHWTVAFFTSHPRWTLQPLFSHWAAFRIVTTIIFYSTGRPTQDMDSDTQQADDFFHEMFAGWLWKKQNS